MASGCAAPHRPAGHFSPYSDSIVTGRRTAFAKCFANLQRCRTGCRGCGQPLRPVTIRGEGAGWRMRGSADFGNQPIERYNPIL
ncbi:MAG: hypothetical protein EOR78_29100 [Mesorhizobium sp.]|nr:MAG: hypothetical protein EOR49_28115 [Mesorhizobium sp.]RWM40358.1 MAG: hypothetical protein EOR76_35770 [Mesorhizobium sp.]RWM48741.1 MAG: hypothetical protein EOR78_29100 [Mesorhizobium sp.]RWM55091.1 MAG: hypothetical protein EOR79_22660 [Mesorhizobium sp.]RWM93013.1 MAG: hypothetical protein EOR85_27865 [Mesorhizobium sp.]